MDETTGLNIHQETTNQTTCRQCRSFRACSRLLRNLGCNPDNPNDDARRLCVRWRAK